MLFLVCNILLRYAVFMGRGRSAELLTLPFLSFLFLILRLLFIVNFHYFLLDYNTQTHIAFV